MKKLNLLICLSLFAVACTENVSDVIPQEESANNVSTIRSFDEALQIAQSSISLVDGTGQTRSGSPRKIDLNNWKIFENDLKTRANSNSNDTLMYVFNFEDNQGFAIVSASKETEGLIAVTESGSYDPSTSSDIDGFNIYMTWPKNIYKILCFRQTVKGWLLLPLEGTLWSITITNLDHILMFTGARLIPKGSFVRMALRGALSRQRLRLCHTTKLQLRLI